MSSRKIRYYDSTSGTTVTAKVTLDKTKKYKLDKTTGAIQEVTTTNVLADDELTIPGSKSALRRLGDLERNVSILASKAGVSGQSNLDTDTLLKTGGTITGNLTVQGSTSLAGATLSGDLTVNGGDIVLGGTGRIQGIDTVSASTDAASKGYVDTAVANLVSAAPTTLDTLNELAAALGDDPNFATTMTTALAGKAATTITISAGTDLSGGGSLAANRIISHAAVGRTNTTSSQTATHSGAFTVVDSITTSSTGHITGVNTKTITLPADNNTTYGAATSTVLGLVKLEDDTVQSVAANAVSATASRTYGVQVNSSGQLVVNVPWVNTNTTYGVATTSSNGLMASTDKTKLDGIEAGATADQTKADIDALGIAASTAATLATARTIGMSGVTATATSFNGGANITIPVTAVPATLLTGTIADARISGAYTGMTNLTGSGTVDFAKFLGNAADTAALPSFSWTGDTNTGMYQPAADQLGFATGGVSRAVVSATGLSVTGAITATGDVTAYSDDRLKTDITTIDGALDKVAKVRGVNFTRKEDGSRSTGVVAQELAAVLPEAVKTDEYGMHHVAYGNITGLLIEAIKELKDEIDYLKGLK